MDSLRVILILIGIALIIGLVAHGLWTLRSNQQRSGDIKGQGSSKRQKGAQADLLDGSDTTEADSGSFDELGLSKVRMRPKQNAPAASAEQSAEQPTEKTPDHSSETIAEVEAKAQPEIAATLRSRPDDEEPELPSFRAESRDSSSSQAAASSTPIRAERHDKPEKSETVEQLNIGLPESEVSEEDAEAPKEEVITLYVSGDIQGTILLQTVTELGLKFGDLDIFHRYEQPSGRGPLLFRMANMYNPGTFDLDDLENFRTRGVVLFMALPIKYDGHKAFTMMYNAANKIAEAMPRAAVLDHNRNPMTKQSVQHTYQRIREFERRQRLAGLRSSSS
ncbi:cell division protein ZipA [Aliidiomarina halalkaliphila]|uniref:Cell division protein ZipA n=1 Tax=Aliidiomarina halalkaliphila TaxID=2593535 RepID=A0A552X4S7_9GAMM|nr:cell division protein ZipA [Aliidiomarina halalkaliphila]TRW50028.1 cell division protein ZipA [Aliidiomarina halalkaliphila]